MHGQKEESETEEKAAKDIREIQKGHLVQREISKEEKGHSQAHALGVARQDARPTIVRPRSLI